MRIDDASNKSLHLCATDDLMLQMNEEAFLALIDTASSGKLLLSAAKFRTDTAHRDKARNKGQSKCPYDLDVPFSARTS